MKITNKQMEILKKHFKVYDVGDFSLEQWTNGGVDMFIDLDLECNDDIITQLENYINNFDIDQEIDLYRQDERYRNDFTITESVKDFKDWIKFIENIIIELKEENISVKEHLKYFDSIYEKIETLPRKEVNLREEQKERIKNDLKYFLENLENNIIYRSDYKSILTILKNIQFYGYINEVEEG